MNVAEVKALADGIRGEIAKAVIGQDAAVDLLLTALFAGGHVLLEGPPGTAKTLLAQTFAASLGLEYGRIQFTPDLMPGDIIGANLFNFQTSTFTLTRGPVFCELLLADEINRTPPKTQAALLEAMQERRITIDGQSHELSPRFTVVATQNPIEQQGTYPLPEAQLDRFLFKHVLDYPERHDELAIVLGHGSRAGLPSPQDLGVRRVLDRAGVDAAVEAVAQVRLTDEVAAYVVDLIRATRESADIETGASPRAGAMLALASRAHAALDGRDYVIPDDVKTLAPPALRHRVILSPAAEIEGRRVDQVLAALIDQVAAPR
ncbi:MoxR family ATPase [Phenylobacterium sp. LjRoot164]|uniref:AAA family ATPase n=1 Tax=unclassified Phenylobacterium TaxID=2640670 RepID=UPI003ED0366F